MAPFFSIILPTFNRAGFISKAIQSVIRQSHASWELIVIDDGSTDDTEEVVKGFGDERIQYHWQQNEERSAARNKGIALAQGKYICFLDSDDYYQPDHLAQLQQAIAEYGDTPAIFFVNTLQDEQGHTSKVPAPNFQFDKAIDNALTHSIGVPRWCVHRSAFDHYQFDPSIRVGEDKDWLVRAASQFPLVEVPVWTVAFCEHDHRTVNHSVEDNLALNIQHIRRLISGYPQVSTKAKRMALATAYYNLGRHYAQTGKRIKAVMSFWHASRYQPAYKLKRKIALLLGRG